MTRNDLVFKDAGKFTVSKLKIISLIFLVNFGFASVKFTENTVPWSVCPAVGCGECWNYRVIWNYRDGLSLSFVAVFSRLLKPAICFHPPALLSVQRCPAFGKLPGACAARSASPHPLPLCMHRPHQAQSCGCACFQPPGGSCTFTWSLHVAVGNVCPLWPDLGFLSPDCWLQLPHCSISRKPCVCWDC